MRIIALAALAASVISIPSYSASAADKPKPLFEGSDVISITLSGPLNGISRDPNAKPVAGTLKVNGTAESLPVALETRGITRRMKQTCSFPPLRVIFNEKPGKDSIFRKQKALKLVTHCQSAERFQQYVLLEYSAYRLFQTMTQESFNVRLAKVDYTDESGRPITTRLGFFIEDINDVARRNGHRRFRGASRIQSSQLDPDAAARFAVFQYMISNLDWAMTAAPAGQDCCHNSRLLGAKDATTGFITVPYDFDYSGLVDAPYAVPPDGIRVANVRVRRYRGFCSHNQQARAFAADLAARKASLLAIVDQTPELSDSSRQKAANYLGEFFDQAGTPAKWDEVLKSCLP